MPSDATTRRVENEAGLRDIMGPTMDIAIHKSRPMLDRHCKAFIARSPLLCIGTANADGKADVSPRGDPPGFVQIIGDNQLFIPDRPGNNRLDTMTNIVENPNVGLLFVIPGFNDTLRVNGSARIVEDDEKAEQAKVRGKAPKVGILVEVNEVFALRQGVHALQALGSVELPGARRLPNARQHDPRTGRPGGQPADGNGDQGSRRLH